MNLYGNLDAEKAMAGMLYGLNPKTIVSIPAGENINYGKGVFLNSDGVLKASKAGDEIFAGVSVFHQNAFLDSRGCYIPTEAVNVMEKGYIWVVLADNVTPVIEASAYVTPAGTFTTESSGNALVGKFKSGKETGSNSDSLALVALD